MIVIGAGVIGVELVRTSSVWFSVVRSMFCSSNVEL